MREESITADRLTGFSDTVFAVIVTVMVLELKETDSIERRRARICLRC
jgi:uncharacterized membrane protein